MPLPLASTASLYITGGSTRRTCADAADGHMGLFGEIRVAIDHLDERKLFEIQHTLCAY
jgi:hypothetical protein